MKKSETKNKIITVYHGSQRIIEKPIYGEGKPYNDYGVGFYCTEHLDIAKEWACTERTSGFANCYYLDLEGLKVLDLSLDNYTILNWLAILVDNRRVRISSPIVAQGISWLKDNHLVDISKYDIIKGYRADDAYFSFARAFLNNGISLDQLSRAMHLGELGEQYMLRSKKAFGQTSFVGAEAADQRTYYVRRKERDEKAREAYEKELERIDLHGEYIRDLIKGSR